MGLVAKSLPLRPYDIPTGDGSKQVGDAEMQCIEDAACLVFLEEDLRTDFPAKYEDMKMVDILAKAWKKMSRVAHAQALTLDYTPRMLGCVAEAIAVAEGCGAAPNELCLPVPVPSRATQEILRETWKIAGGESSRFGQALGEELQKQPNYKDELAAVLSFPVCRPSNLSLVIRVLMDALFTDKAPTESEPPRFASVLHGAALLAQRHAGLRLKHVHAIRISVVSAMCRLCAGSGEKLEKECRQAWDSFTCAIGAQMAPALLLSDSTVDLCAATATALPTPGAGPTSAILAAQGAALVEMAVALLLSKKAEEGGAPDKPGSPSSSLAESAAKLAELRQRSLRAAQMDSHHYCGLLSEAVFDSCGGNESERKARRAAWTTRCTETPLEMARCGVAVAKLAVDLKAQVLEGAASCAGDLEAGKELSLSAAKVALSLADMNLKSSPSPKLDEESKALAKAVKELQAK